MEPDQSGSCAAPDQRLTPPVAHPGKAIYGYLAPQSKRDRMQSRAFAAASLAIFAVAASAQQRPKITGISHIAVYASDPAATGHFYTAIVGAAKLPDPENPQGVPYAISATQFVEVLPLPANVGINRLDHTAWNTESAEGMRKYLAAKGWK